MTGSAIAIRLWLGQSIALASVVVVIATAIACSSGSALRAPSGLDTAPEKRGQLVFFAHCEQCHPQGGAGVGPAIDRASMSPAALRALVRAGYGDMRSFSPYEISEPDLLDLISYLEAMRHSEPR